MSSVRQDPSPQAVDDVPSVEEIEKIIRPKLIDLLKHAFDDPKSVYPVTYGLDAPWPQPPGTVTGEDGNVDANYHKFRLAEYFEEPLLTGGERHVGLTAAEDYLTRIKSKFVGFQASMDVNANDPKLSHYLDSHINNIGDPFSVGSFNHQSKFMERPLLDYFAQLWHGEWPHTREKTESYWGFVLSMGGTEGNLYGMWNGRDYLSGKVLVTDFPSPDKSRARGRRRKPTAKYVQPKMAGNLGTPLCYYSDHTHYSLKKAMVILNIQTFSAEGRAKYPNKCPIEVDISNPKVVDGWPEEVPSNEDGTINLDALEKLVDFFASKQYPTLINFNYGTTFTGAYDDVYSAGKRLEPILKKHGMWEREIEVAELPKPVTRNGFWFHVDGALGAAYMPFVEIAHECKLFPERGPAFDFRNEFVHSIAMSGHKWIGAPVPCGVFMTKTKFQLNPPGTANYIAAPDTTFAGSRSGLSALLLWDHFARHSHAHLVQRALYTQNMAQYMKTKLSALSDAKPELELDVRRAPLSLSLTFRRPKDWIVHKFSLSKEEMDGKLYVHAFAMGHVTNTMVDELVRDLQHTEAFPSEDELEDPTAATFAVADLVTW